MSKATTPAPADISQSPLGSILACLALGAAATLCLAQPALSDEPTGHNTRPGYIGLWGYFTTCRAANDFMFSYRRGRAEMPHETVGLNSMSCRVLSRRGASPRWELELICQVWSGAQPPPVLRLRQMIVALEGGQKLNIESLNRTTGETRHFNVFYCRQHHEPERLPRGILEERE